MTHPHSDEGWTCSSEDAELQNLFAFADLPPDEKLNVMMSFLELIEEGRRQLGIPPIGVTKAMEDASRVHSAPAMPTPAFGQDAPGAPPR
jgi:hypothetical protein